MAATLFLAVWWRPGWVGCPGVGLAANKRITNASTSCVHFMQYKGAKDQRVLRNVLGLLPVTWPTRSNFYAYNVYSASCDQVGGHMM